MMYSVATGNGFLGIEINDKLSGTLSLGRIVVVTGWNNFFFSVGNLFKISTGALVSNTGTASIVNGLVVSIGDVSADLHLLGVWY